ncbi:hypothetical protein ACFQY7_07150 [Actinomadura luteofluorescens]
MDRLGRDLREILYPEDFESAPPSGGPDGKLDLARLLGRTSGPPIWTGPR